jgi:hypothetical protein
VIADTTRVEVGESMASKYLDGSMVPRNVKRNVDHRSEPRRAVQSETAILQLRGRNYVVPLVNLSPSGAMVIFSLIPSIGETIRLQLTGRAPLDGRVCWIRDGKVGINLSGLVE